jgi:hypothetical protein
MAIGRRASCRNHTMNLLHGTPKSTARETTVVRPSAIQVIALSLGTQLSFRRCSSSVSSSLRAYIVSCIAATIAKAWLSARSNLSSLAAVVRHKPSALTCSCILCDGMHLIIPASCSMCFSQLQQQPPSLALFAPPQPGELESSQEYWVVVAPHPLPRHCHPLSASVYPLIPTISPWSTQEQPPHFTTNHLPLAMLTALNTLPQLAITAATASVPSLKVASFSSSCCI